MDGDEGALAPSQAHTADDNNAAVLLGLYLLLLAFFILLVSISQVVESRSSAALDSVKTTFSPAVDATAPIAFAPVVSGPIVGMEDFHGRIRAAVEAALPVAEITTAQAGRVMRVRVSTNVAFVRGEARLSRAMPPFMERLSGAMHLAVEGWRAEIELRVGMRDTAEPAVAGDAALAIARAGLLAREFVSAGIAPAAIASGVDTDLTALEIRFSVVPTNTARVTFDALAGER